MTLHEIINTGNMIWETYGWALALGFMLVLFWFGVTISNSIYVGVMVAETFNCFNLSLYMASFMGLAPIKPLLPIWASVLILAIPFIAIFLRSHIFEGVK